MKKAPKLTDKEKRFADHLINNPKHSRTEAAAQTYNVSNRHVAEQIAYENMMKPEVKSYLAAHSNDIENALLNTFNEYKESNKLPERIHSTQIGMYVHDKIHGKATQKTEQHSTVVTLHLNLSDITEDQQR